MSPDPVSRRQFVLATGALGASAPLAGCSDQGDDGGGDGGTTVEAGPGGNLTFDPEEVTVSTGDTVEWSFEAAGHNVSAKPDAHEKVSIPDDAEPFASYQGDNRMQTVDSGGTFSHTFETAGEYTYVCVPHAGQGMVGTVVVE